MRQPDTDRRWLRPPSLLGPKGLTGRFPLPSSLPRIIFGEHHLIRSPWPFGRVVLGSQCLVYRRLALGFGNLPRGYRIQPDLVKYPSDGRGTPLRTFDTEINTSGLAAPNTQKMSA